MKDNCYSGVVFSHHTHFIMLRYIKFNNTEFTYSKLDFWGQSEIERLKGLLVAVKILDNPGCITPHT